MSKYLYTVSREDIAFAVACKAAVCGVDFEAAMEFVCDRLADALNGHLADEIRYLVEAFADEQEAQHVVL